MEKYINKNTIIKNETFEILKDNITCTICKKLLIKPFMCTKCQNNFCKKCIDNRKNKKVKCPQNCKNSLVNEIKGNKNLLTKCKFVCINGCGEEIEFDNINKHYKSKCLKKNKKNIKNIKNKKLEILTKEEVAKIKKQKKKEMKYLTSKL